MKPFCTPKQHIVTHFEIPMQQPFGPIHLCRFFCFSVHNDLD